MNQSNSVFVDDGSHFDVDSCQLLDQLLAGVRDGNHLDFVSSFAQLA